MGKRWGWRQVADCGRRAGSTTAAPPLLSGPPETGQPAPIHPPSQPQTVTYLPRACMCRILTARSSARFRMYSLEDRSPWQEDRGQRGQGVGCETVPHAEVGGRARSPSSGLLPRPARRLALPPAAQHLAARPGRVLLGRGGGGPVGLQQKLLDLRRYHGCGRGGWGGCTVSGGRLRLHDSAQRTHACRVPPTTPTQPHLDKHDLKGRDVDAVVHVLSIRVDAAGQVGGCEGWYLEVDKEEACVGCGGWACSAGEQDPANVGVGCTRPPSSPGPAAPPRCHPHAPRVAPPVGAVSPVHALVPQQQGGDVVPRAQYRRAAAHLRIPVRIGGWVGWGR